MRQLSIHRKASMVAISGVLAASLFMLGGCSANEASEPSQSADGTEAPITTPDSTSDQAGYGKPLDGFTAPTEVAVTAGEGCSECHGQEGFRVLNDDHEGRTDDTCLSCHQVNATETGAEIPHAIGN